MATTTTKAIQYDYNTGKPLQAGQAQSLYNTKTGQKIGVPASTNPLANQSTTTLSTANAQNKVVGIKNQIATNNQNGLKTTTGADGNSVSTYADNSVYTPPEAPQPVLSGQGGYYGDQYVPPNTETPIDAKGKPVNLTPYSPAQQTGLDDLAAIRARANANAAALIGQIQNQYADLIAQQNLANNSANAGATAYTIGGGRGVASGDAVVQQTVSYGIQKVKELVDAENMAIVQANTAATNNDWQMASKINDIIAGIKQQQQDAVIKLNDDILAAKKELQAQQDKIISDIAGIAKDAKANGADTATVNAILNSKDVGSAINASGSYLQTGTGVLGDWLQYKRDTEAKGLVPMDYQTYKDQQDAKAEKLKNSSAYSSAYNSAAGKAAAEAKYGVTPTTTLDTEIDPTSKSILSQTGLSGNAFFWLTGRSSQLPRDQATRNAAAAEATAWANKNGVDISTLPAQYDAYNKVLSFNTVRQSMAVVQENEILGTVNNLSAVAPNGDISGLRWANVLKIWAGQEVNDPIAQQYAFHLEQLRNEVVAYNLIAQGQINTDGSLKQANDADVARVEQVIKGGVSSGSLEGLSNAVTNSTSKMKPILQTSLDAARLAVWNLFGVGDKFQTSTAPADPKTEVDTYISSNPTQADTIAKMYEVPGATEQDIYDYLKANGLIK